MKVGEPVRLLGRVNMVPEGREGGIDTTCNPHSLLWLLWLFADGSLEPERETDNDGSCSCDPQSKAQAQGGYISLT